MFYFLMFSYIIVQHIVEKNHSLLYIEVSDSMEIQDRQAVCFWNDFCSEFCTSTPVPLSLSLLLSEYITKPTCVSTESYFLYCFD